VTPRRYATLILPLLAPLALARCVSSDSDATVEAPDLTTGTSADPEFLRRAADVLNGTRDSDVAAGREQVVIIRENEDGLGSDWVVMDRAAEITLLSPATNCDDDGDDIDEGDLWQILDVGDLISYSTAGPDGEQDTVVCTGEVDVRAKAAVRP
jgi:hypothetical protein